MSDQFDPPTDTQQTVQPWDGAPKKSADDRKSALSRSIASQLAIGDRRIETQSDFSAVIVQGKPVNHILHLIISVLTCGLWAIVWIIMVLTGGEKREMLSVDEWGNPSIQRL